MRDCPVSIYIIQFKQHKHAGDFFSFLGVEFVPVQCNRLRYVSMNVLHQTLVPNWQHEKWIENWFKLVVDEDFEDMKQSDNDPEVSIETF